jgi:hypothetical protein
MIYHVLGIGVAFLAALISWYIVEYKIFDNVATVAGFLAVVIGSLVELLWLIVLDRNRTINKLTAIDNNQKTLCNTLVERIQKYESLRHFIHYQVALSKQQLIEVWIDLLNRMCSSYSATNYIEAGTIYTTDWANGALLIQNSKKKLLGASMVIKKVFIINDESEITAISDHLNRQRQIGIDIHFLPLKEIQNDHDLSVVLATTIDRFRHFR